MSERDPPHLRRRDAHAHEAAAWLAKWQAGTVDEAAFVRWRDADPAHAIAYARIASVWRAIPANSAEPTVSRRRLMQGGMAGAVLVAAGTGLFATRAYAWDSASTGVGETRKLRLPDNSMVALNTDTELFWRFSASRRELWLKRGEVAIDLGPGPVAHLDSERVNTLLAAGRFNARLRDDRLELTVLRGKASLATPAGNAAPVDVHPYQRLSFTDAVPAVKPMSSESVAAELAWQNGEIVFPNIPLADAVMEYNRYLLHKIVIDDPAVGKIRVGGRFLSSDPTDFLDSMSAGLGVRVRSTDAGYHLSR